MDTEQVPNEEAPIEDQSSAVSDFLKDVKQEGDQVDFGNNEENPAESSTAKTEEKSSSVKEDESVTDEKPAPFHEHPRFKKVISEKNEMKEKLDEALGKIDELVQSGQQPQTTQIEDWFKHLYGDNPEAWQAFQQFNSNQLKELKKTVVSEMQEQQKQQVDQTKYWENWVQDQVDELKADGKQFDQNKLFKIMEDYKPTDPQGNLDFNKGYELYERLEGSKQAEKAEKNKARKEVASQTTSSGKGTAPDSSQVDMKKIRSSSFLDLVQD